MNLRLDLVNLFGTCSKLVMKAVPCIDRIGSGELGDASRKDLKDLVQTIDNQTNDLVSQMRAMEDVTSFNCTTFEVCLSLYFKYKFHLIGMVSSDAFTHPYNSQLAPECG